MTGNVRPPRSVRLLAAALLCLHGLLLAYSAAVHSPNLNEVAHLPSGISHWRFLRFDLYCVNPPLIRMVAALPVLFADPTCDWSGWSVADPGSRSEFTVGRDFLRANGDRSFVLYTLARWACIPLSLLAGWICFRWSCELYGSGGGVASLVLYVFCPNFLAWGASITPDAGSSSLGLLASYAFWSWWQRPSWRTVSLAGLCLGLAVLAKSVWIFLLLLWPAVWAFNACSARKSPDGSKERAPGAQLLAILGLAVYVVNAGYAFDKTLTPLGQFSFVSRWLAGTDAGHHAENRFRETWLKSVPVPLPGDLIQGIDIQRRDFEQGAWCYLNGKQQQGGWWHFYFHAIAMKAPAGHLILFATTALGTLVGSLPRRGWRHDVFLLAPAFAVLLLASSQTGLTRYLRYVLPCLPFLYVWAGRMMLTPRRGWIRRLTLTSLTFSTVSSLAVFPHAMSYFNELIGGPLKGHAYLLDANIDWGQDLLYLKAWSDAHPEAQPLHVAYFGAVELEALPWSSDWQRVPPDVDEAGTESDRAVCGPQPGWHAVSVNHLCGYRHTGEADRTWTYLQRFRPFDRPSYSIHIYYLGPEEVGRTREQMGLPRL